MSVRPGLLLSVLAVGPAGCSSFVVGADRGAPAAQRGTVRQPAASQVAGSRHGMSRPRRSLARSRLQRVVAVLILAVLTACTNGDPAPATLPTLGPAGSAPPGPAPAVTGPPVVVPAGTSAATPAGAVAFARFFYAQVEAAYTRHDAALVRRYSLPTCVACTRWADQVEMSRRASQRVTGVVFDISSATAPEFVGTTVTVRVAYSSPSGHRYDRNGTQVASSPAQPAAVELLGLTRERGTWRVASASLH